MICLFLYGDFDFLVAVRTALNHSWTNPAERIMSILNLGLQGVALKRDQMSSESEALFDMANTLDDIRKKAQEFNELKSELKESIASVQNLLNNRSERILLKEKKFKCHNPASEESIAELFEVKMDILFICFFDFYAYTNILLFMQSIFDIDSTLGIEETTQAQIRRHSALIGFMNTHCHTRVQREKKT